MPWKMKIQVELNCCPLFLQHEDSISDKHNFTVYFTGKSLSKAFIFESTNPKYDDRLFIELRDQYMRIASSEHVMYTNCFLFLFWHSEQFMYTTCSEIGIFMYWPRNSMNNLLSYYGLVDDRISASEKDLPV